MDIVDGVSVVNMDAFEEPVGMGDFLWGELGEVFVAGGQYCAPVSGESGVVDGVSEGFCGFHGVVVGE